MYRIKIKPYIKERKISQYKMAEDLEWTPAYLSLFINNKTPVTLENLEKVIKYLNVSILDVLEDVDENNEPKKQIMSNQEIVCPHCGKSLKITLKIE